MASIDRYLDAALPLMKARAAEMVPDGSPVTGYPLPPARVDSILERIHIEAAWALTAQAYSERSLRRESLLDVMNLCALALSLTEPETPEVQP